VEGHLFFGGKRGLERTNKSFYFLVVRLKKMLETYKMVKQTRRQQRQRRDCSHRKSHQQRGGGANDVTNPSEYYGVNSGAYFQEGSPELGAYSSAYDTNATPSMFGNNIAPGSGVHQHSGLQTGGRRHKQQQQKQKGGIWEALALDVASKMLVPGAFFAAKEGLNNHMRKRSRKQKSKSKAKSSRRNLSIKSRRSKRSR
jgi:hypothetical protein